ncbi:MAG: hypothetical protein ACRC2T_04640 [Thermoguttaceae bacterium]
MLYLAIDQHKYQLTINLRNEHGDIIQKEQVSTTHDDINEIFDNLVEKSRKHRGFMAILEVYGFNAWFIEKLKKYNCTK